MRNECKRDTESVLLRLEDQLVFIHVGPQVRLETLRRFRTHQEEKGCKVLTGRKRKTPRDKRQNEEEATPAGPGRPWLLV